MCKSRFHKVFRLSAVAILTAVFGLIVFREGSLPLQCDGYAPPELLVNCFHFDQMWEYMSVSQRGKQMLIVDGRNVYWTSDWDDRFKARTIVDRHPFRGKVKALAFS